jgi:hypothetical protein
MRTILFLMLSATVASAEPGDWNFMKVAEMMVDRETCQIDYDQSKLADDLTKGSLARGVSMGDGSMIAARLAVALQQRIRSSVGEAQYCSTRH